MNKVYWSISFWVGTAIFQKVFFSSKDACDWVAENKGKPYLGWQGTIDRIRVSKETSEVLLDWEAKKPEGAEVLQ